jgi:phosphoribosylaminoimidazole-succinocarboxamide synthase|tara:strand:+ start:986 stop:1681 length:696 start_codon:yes stop_codon:yes gene_type:complete
MKLIYSGKAKSVYENEDNTLLIEFRDDLTAGDGTKKDTKSGKGSLNAEISASLLKLVEKNGVKTHLIDFQRPNKFIVKKLKIILLEVICRNIATGSLVKRFPFKDGQHLVPPTIEFGYKSDDYHDPMLNDDIAIALGVATHQDLQEMRQMTMDINKILQDFLISKDIILVDFKLEFGRTDEGELLLGDEISPDTCRFWDAETKEILDKDRFRQDLGNVIEFYKEVKRRVCK